MALVDWFHTQTGTAGVGLLALSVVGGIAFLIRWQVERQGKGKVIKAYAICLALLAILHFASPHSNTAVTPTVLASGQSTTLPHIIEPPREDKLSGIERKLLERTNRRGTRVRSTASPESGSIGKELEKNQVQWVDGVFTPIAFWVIGIGVFLYIMRAHPQLLRFSWLKSIFNVSKWIRPTRSKTNELGSGDLASAKQIKKWLSGSDKYDTKLPCRDLRGSSGVVAKTGELVIPRGQRNRHMLIIAKTGSGKTTKLILPILYNDCLCPHRSTIIIDSKQEMWAKLSSMTKKHNPHKNLILFNPLDIYRSLSWNILGKVHTDTDCKLIANSVIMATDEPQAKQDSPFFRNSALQILNAIMVGLMYDNNDVLSMPRIHELLNTGMHGLCDWLEAHPRAIRTTKAFVDLARSGSQNADTIMSELSMRLQAWDLLAIRSTTFIDEIDIEKIILEPSLFVVELRESELKMLRPLANVIVVELLRYMTKYAEECPGQTLPRPVGLVIDEFASALGRLPDIHIKLNTLRSRNVSIVAAIQSIGQIKGNYGEDWESVLSGFSTKIFMPSLDYTDSEWASKESGIMTVRYRTSSKGDNRKITENFAQRNTSTNEQIQQRAVLTPDEVGRPSDSQATFFMPETPVFQGHLVPYYQIPTMLKRIEGAGEGEAEVKLRKEAIAYEEVLPEPIIRTNEDSAEARDSDIIADEELWAALDETKTRELGWNSTTGDARKWWEAFEEENKTRIALVLKVAQEIASRGASITDFFLAYVYSNTDNIQATLAYLDYTMHMKTAEA